jgi:uncharacterized membrane protein
LVRRSVQAEPRTDNHYMKAYVQAKRSLVKAITFRTMILCSDAVVIFLITHRWDTTVGLVIATNLASTTLYFVHERVWSRIAWGRSVESHAKQNPP